MKGFLMLSVLLSLFLALGCNQSDNPTSPEADISFDENTKLKRSTARLDSTEQMVQTVVTAQQQTATLWVPDDYPTIQSAVDAANPGDMIFVKSSGSPYNERVTIHKDGLRLFAKSQVAVNGQFLVRADDVRIRGFKVNHNILGSGGAIDLNGVTGVTVMNNIITDAGSLQGRGIAVINSSNCVLKGNTCVGMPLGGIFLLQSEHIKIALNTCTGGSSGIVLAHASNNLLKLNDFSSNRFRGMQIGNSSNHNKVIGNTINENGSEGIAVFSSNENQIGPNNEANFNGRDGIILFSSTSENRVIKNDCHCNSGDDICDRGTDNILIRNSTGPLPECQ